MRQLLILPLVLGILGMSESPEPLPSVPDDWAIERLGQAPEIQYPTAIVVGDDGTIYLGQHPMDMPGPPTEPIDSVVTIKDGHIETFADELWAVLGLEWIDETLYVVHAPYLSALRDTNGDGRADKRIDLMTGLGPDVPGFNGINNHVPAGLRLGMDGFLYVAIGDKGIPAGVGKDGTTISMQGGGVIRIRPDGSDLEIVSTGERNPLSVALTNGDDIITYGNDDDSKKWPNSLTHHIVGGHHGYPYEFLLHPDRCLPIIAGQAGGAGAQGICYGEAGLPEEYRGDFFFCDWGRQTVFRIKLARSGGTFRLVKREPFVTSGAVSAFRPFSIAPSADGKALYLVDWAFDGWGADGPKTGRLYRLTYQGPDAIEPGPRTISDDVPSQIAALDHPSRSVRLRAQRLLASKGAEAVPELVARLEREEPEVGRVHALWALDAIGGPGAVEALRTFLEDAALDIRLQAARRAGIRADQGARGLLEARLFDDDPAVRREVAIALGKLGDPAAGPALMAALTEEDRFAAWSIRQAIRTLKAWDAEAIVEALNDPNRRDGALKLTADAWAVPVAEALTMAVKHVDHSETRAKVVANLSGLHKTYPEWSGEWFGTDPLAGSLPRKTEPWDLDGMARVLAGLVHALNDPEASVRRQAIPGLQSVGKPVAPYIRARLEREEDAQILEALALTLGALADQASIPTLDTLLHDASKPLIARTAALDALGVLGTPDSLRSRFLLLFDPEAPAELVARALPPLAQAGTLPANDLSSFLERPEPSVRVAVLHALATRPELPEHLQSRIRERLDDPDPEVRRAALGVIAQHGIRSAIPQILTLTDSSDTGPSATLALAALPDPRALPVYLAALKDSRPDLRSAAESALIAIRDQVTRDLHAQLQADALDEPTALAIERVLNRFQPITSWRVIGPLAEADRFLGEPSIDFAQPVGGSVSWRNRRGEPETGQVSLNDLQAEAGSDFGSGLISARFAFGYTEVTSDRERPALLLVGSSGSIRVELNGELILDTEHPDGRPYAPDSERIRVHLKSGVNRLLIRSASSPEGWTFGIQVSEPTPTGLSLRPRDGDSRRGRNTPLR